MTHVLASREQDQTTASTSYWSELADCDYVIAVKTPTDSRVLPLRRQSTLVVGRTPECDVFIDDASVSRKHARVFVGEPCFVEDLGSTNTTKLNGHPIERSVRVPIRSGDVLRFGSATAILQRLHETEPAALGATGEGDAAKPRLPLVLAPVMVKLYETVALIAPTPLSVLILGETGVGKELVTSTIHALSTRANSPFVKLNCAALPESLLESELFGFEKGAFTGATQAKPGLFESADGGTLFLDELGEMPLTTQAKLLRVLETGEVTRIGSVRPRVVDVRFIGATNRDLRAMSAQNTFRSDLYFRISGATLTVPPLRERVEEIVPLAEHFLARFLVKIRKPALHLSSATKRRLESYSWPGNVRELRNVIERAAILSRGETVDTDVLAFDGAAPQVHLGPRIAERPTQRDLEPLPTQIPPPVEEAHGELKGSLREFERDRILDALRRTGGNQTKAAKLLGVSRRTLINKLDAYEVERPRRK